MSQNEVTRVFRWNDKEYPFDIRNVEDAEKFEQAAADMTEEARTLAKTGKISDMIRAQCVCIKDFFVTCFGEDTAAEILGDKQNLEVYYSAYHALCETVTKQKEYFTQIRNTFNQFSNRQQRRHPNGGKGGKGNKPIPYKK